MGLLLDGGLHGLVGDIPDLVILGLGSIGLLTWDNLFLTFLDDDILAKLFLFYRGVQMTPCGAWLLLG